MYMAKIPWDQVTYNPKKRGECSLVSDQYELAASDA